MKKKLAVTVFFCVITVIYTSAQKSDENFRKQAIQNLVSLYYQSLNSDAEIYNAPLYDRHIPAFTAGHPFLYSDSFSIGTIGYNGLVYTDVPVLYDVVRDELITRTLNGFAIALIKLKVDSFSYAGHSFINLSNDSAADTKSYFERLYNGNIQFVAKRKKTVQISSGTLALERRLDVQDRYYLYRDGLLETVKNKNGLLNALKDKKNVLQQFIKHNNLKLKKSFEEDAARVVAYYDQLN